MASASAVCLVRPFQAISHREALATILLTSHLTMPLSSRHWSPGPTTRVMRTLCPSFHSPSTLHQGNAPASLGVQDQIALVLPHRHPCTPSPLSAAQATHTRHGQAKRPPASDRPPAPRHQIKPDQPDPCTRCIHTLAALLFNAFFSAKLLFQNPSLATCSAPSIRPMRQGLTYQDR